MAPPRRGSHLNGGDDRSSVEGIGSAMTMGRQAYPESPSIRSRTDSGSQLPKAASPLPDAATSHVHLQIADERLHNEIKPIHLKFTEIEYTVDDNGSDKTILNGISGEVRPGELLAIMGPSGSGKTTLLNVLSGRILRNVNGECLVNGKKRTKALKRKTGFVQQEDVLFHHLTVAKTLEYQSLLRCPKTMNRSEKVALAHKVIDALRLRMCKNTIVGNAIVRGVSGGERKRVCIGSELLTNPSILFLDEPTSGLDSSSALFLLELLKTLANEGRTVITTIHQPSSHMYALFDKLLLLADGHTMYFGAAAKATSYFEKLGYHCDRHWNPADYMIELVADVEHFDSSNQYALTTSDGKVETWEQRKQKFIAAYAEHREVSESHQDSGTDATNVPNVVSVDSMDEDAVREMQLTAAARKASQYDVTTIRRSKDKWPISWFEQFRILTARAFQQKKSEALAIITVFQIFFLSAFSALLWFRLDKTEEALDERLGFIFFAGVFFGFFPLFNALMTFPPERAVINKERATGSYRLSAYFMAKSIAEVPLDLFYPTLYVLLTYWTVGLNTSAGSFFKYLFVMLFSSLAAQSIGVMISAAVTQFKQAMVFAALFMLASMLSAGFYADADEIPSWFRWIQYASFVRYTYEAMLHAEFSDSSLIFQCASSTSSKYAQCPGAPITGPDVLIQEDKMTLTFGENVLILFVYLLVARVLAYMFLRYWNRPKDS